MKVSEKIGLSESKAAKEIKNLILNLQLELEKFI
jgi:hypothetical protein